MSRHTCHLALCMLLTLSAVRPAAALSNEQPRLNAASQITEITLQRTGCLGRCPIDELTLRTDGTAQYTGKMNTARTGQYKGTFRKGEFGQLWRWLESSGFFTMKESHGLPDIYSPDQIISAVRDRQRKTLVNHGGASLVLWGIESAIRGVAADIVWHPESSGIRGVLTGEPKTSAEFPRTPTARVLSTQIVTVRTAREKQEFMLVTDEEGRFEVALRPGTYIVEIPNRGRNSQTVTPQQTVVVYPDKLSEVVIRMDRVTD
jgi:hypothetical protein